jgi:hypothetical protein
VEEEDAVVSQVLTSIFKRSLDLILLTLFGASVAVILIAQDEPFARDWLCTNLPCPELPHPKAWKQISNDLAIGSLVSLIF